MAAPRDDSLKAADRRESGVLTSEPGVARRSVPTRRLAKPAPCRQAEPDRA